jgi:hypothetical protein
MDDGHFAIVAGDVLYRVAVFDPGILMVLVNKCNLLPAKGIIESVVEDLKKKVALFSLVAGNIASAKETEITLGD